MSRKQRTRAFARTPHPQTATSQAAVAPVSAPPPVRAPVAIVPPAAAVTAPPLGWVRQDWLFVLGAVLVALVLYSWRLGEPSELVFDEVYHGFTASEIVKGNADAWVWYTQPPPGVAYEWTHPALSKLLIGLGIRIFGDDAIGRRAMSALFGALAIGLIYAMGRLMFNRWVGLLAASLLLLDGLWFVQSRIAMNDVFLATFLMVAWLGVYLYLRGPADATRRYLWIAGVGLACAFATKWSAGYSVGLIGLIVVAREGWTFYKGRLRTPVWKVLLTLVGVFGLIPIVYLAAYTQFFTMGHTWAEWRELQQQMWWYHSRLEATHPWSSRWWSWPLMLVPVWYHADYARGPADIVSIYGLGNPLVFWAFLPAIVFAIYSWVSGRLREVALAVILAGFFGQWLPWALSPRISFFYHMTPCVPFGCLAIAYGLYQIRAPRVVAIGYLVPVVLAFIYFYPLFSGYPISQEYLEQHYWMQRWNPLRQ